MRHFRGNACLLLAALIWGMGFVAQSVAMDYIGPFTFLFCRSLLATAALFILSLISKERRNCFRQGKRTHIRGALLCGSALFIASILQQIGVVYTTVGKAGFITALYVLIVPLLGLIFGRKVSKKIWLCIAAAIVGMYLLSLSGAETVSSGDLWVLGCAFCFAVQIMLVDHFMQLGTDGMVLSCGQFLVTTVLAGIGMLAFETPVLPDILAAAVSILYAGLMSSAAGYTLQIFGQRDTEPATATLLLCMESVFAFVGGIVILHEIPTAREVIGAAIMFAAVVIAQLPEREKKPA